IPDICSCIKLAKLYNVKLDDLVNHSEEKTGIIVPPKGKFFFGPYPNVLKQDTQSILELLQWEKH
ncbi:hypothetical protein ACTPEF_24020, partial [Clostridioides difficile]